MLHSLIEWLRDTWSTLAGKFLLLLIAATVVDSLLGFHSAWLVPYIGFILLFAHLDNLNKGESGE